MPDACATHVGSMNPQCYQPLTESTYTKTNAPIQVHVLAGIPFLRSRCGQIHPVPSFDPRGTPPAAFDPLGRLSARPTCTRIRLAVSLAPQHQPHFTRSPGGRPRLTFRIPPPMVHVLKGCGPVRAYWEVRAPLARREAQLQSASCHSIRGSVGVHA